MSTTAFAREPVEGRDGAKKPFTNELHNKYHKLSRELLMKKLGISSEEVSKAKAEGKKFFELVKEKGITEEQFKMAMLEAKTEVIMQAVKNGDLTKEEGNIKIAKMKEKMKNWKPKGK